MKPRPTKFDVRENTASSRQHAPRFAVRSFPAQSARSSPASQDVSLLSASSPQESSARSPNNAAYTAATEGGRDETAEIFAAIRPVAVDARALVFATREGLPLERWNLLRKHLKPAAKKLGLPGVTWHLLRHSHATMLDSVGTPIGTMQSLLGHSTPEITREIYLHAIPEEQRRAVENVERLVFGPKWTQVQAPTQTTSGRVN